MKDYRRDGEEAARENRASPRHNVHENARMMTLNQGLHAECKILDLSLGGCRMQLEERFPLEQDGPVEVKFTVRGMPLRFSGEVRWWNRQQQVGIEFLRLSERRRGILAAAIQDLRAARQAMRGPRANRYPVYREEGWQRAENRKGSQR